MDSRQAQKEREPKPHSSEIGPFSHLVILLVVAVITITIMLALYRPDMLENVWLWIIGLIGPIIAFVKRTIKSVYSYLRKLEKKQ